MSQDPDKIETDHVPEGDERRLGYELEIAASRDDVWRALTEARELERWFPFQAEVEPGRGGSIRMSWDGKWDGANEIRVWEPGSHLQTTWGSSEGLENTPLVVDFFLESKGGKTVLRLAHHGFDSREDWDELYDGIRRGWTFELQALRHYLEAHPGQDRQVAVASRPLESLSVADAWRRLVSPEGLDLSVNAAKSRASFRFREGETLDGRLLLFEEPREAAVETEAWNRALLRIVIERCGGPEAPIEAMAWVETWGVTSEKVAALEKQLQDILGRTLAV